MERPGKPDVRDRPSVTSSIFDHILARPFLQNLHTIFIEEFRLHSTFGTYDIPRRSSLAFHIPTHHAGRSLGADLPRSMASVTPTAARGRSSRHEVIRSEDWPEEVSNPHSRDWEHMEFNGDGLNTGVRVLGIYS